MSTLLLRLAGPMQSWGTQSRFSVRDTGLEPSKSGLIGLLCAALGRPRSAPPADLAALAMAVRVDREGRLARDYHTAGEVIKADGSKPGTVVSQRYYLADAAFLVALEGSAELLSGLHQALARPVWALFLGRKSFVPGQPVYLPDGCRHDGSYLDHLQTYPWQKPARDVPDRLRLVTETLDPTAGEPRADVPVSFAERRFAVRYVATTWLPTDRLPVGPGPSLDVPEVQACT